MTETNTSKNGQKKFVIITVVVIAVIILLVGIVVVFQNRRGDSNETGSEISQLESDIRSFEESVEYEDDELSDQALGLEEQPGQETTGTASDQINELESSLDSLFGDEFGDDELSDQALGL